MKGAFFHIIENISLIFVITVSTVISQHDFDYSDIETTGASCFPKDSCTRPRGLAFTNRTCECDKKCHQFKDCCIDVQAPPPRFIRNQNLECIGVGVNWGVHAKSQCPANYRGDVEIQSKCEDENDLSFPLAAVPATDVVSNITYRNRYCAHCNNAQAENLKSWDINIECDLMPNDPSINASYVESHLRYIQSDDENVWGFYYPENYSNQYGEPRFYPCKVPFTLPATLERRVRLCRPKLVSTCADDWDRPLVLRKCEAYTAIIYISPQLYRNPHCAVCNNVDILERKCNIPTVTSRDRKPALSFTLLLDVNMNNNNRVGQTNENQCPRNQQWDPFSNRCRKIGCPIPGYKKQNGVCVPP